MGTDKEHIKWAKGWLLSLIRDGNKVDHDILRQRINDEINRLSDTGQWNKNHSSTLGWVQRFEEELSSGRIDLDGLKK